MSYTLQSRPWLVPGSSLVNNEQNVIVLILCTCNSNDSRYSTLSTQCNAVYLRVLVLRVIPGSYYTQHIHSLQRGYRERERREREREGEFSRHSLLVSR